MAHRPIGRNASMAKRAASGVRLRQGRAYPTRQPSASNPLSRFSNPRGAVNAMHLGQAAARPCRQYCPTACPWSALPAANSPWCWPPTRPSLIAQIDAPLPKMKRQQPARHRLPGHARQRAAQARHRKCRESHSAEYPAPVRAWRDRIARGNGAGWWRERRCRNWRIAADRAPSCAKRPDGRQIMRDCAKAPAVRKPRSQPRPLASIRHGAVNPGPAMHHPMRGGGQSWPDACPAASSASRQAANAAW